MKSHNTRPRTTHRYNTDVDELSINRFERADYIYKVKSCLYRDELLQTDQKEEYLRAFPKSLRRYRYHSVINVKIEHITSYAQNYKFLKNMKRKSDMNSDILLADCLEVYKQLPEGHQKEALYDLIGLVIQLKDTDVPRLRESECEKIFRRIQNLVNLINMTRRERITSIEFQLREDDDSPGKLKGNKMTRRIKFLLARFEFIIATLGHFIHYNKLANTLQKKVHSRAINAKPANGAFTTSVFTSMETKTKKDSDPQIRRKQSSSNNNKSVSRKESLDGPVIVERHQNYKEEADEALTESKFQQVKAYFKWKLEKWKDSDLEDIVLVCRICSKSMFAKIMKKHSPHCKKVAEEERIMKEFSKRISNTIHQVTKEKHVVNVELKIEKKQLTTLRAAQLEYSREIDQHNSEEEDSTDSMEATPLQRSQTTSVASFLMNNPSNCEEKYSVKIHQAKDDLKSFVLSNKEAKEKSSQFLDRPSPLFFISPDAEDRESNDSPTDFPPLDDPQSPIARLSREGSRKAVKSSLARSRSQNRLEDEEEKVDFEKQEADLNCFLESMKKVTNEKEEKDENEEIEDIAKEVSLLGISKSKSQYHNKKFPGLEISTKKDFLESPPNEAFPDPTTNGGGAGEQRFGLRRSNTSLIMLGSPLLSATRRSSKKTDKSESPLPKRSDLQTLNALRERLEKIKAIQTLIKGYDAILHYANLLDSFNEFSSEARVMYEQARSEISGFSEKVKSNIKFDEYTKEFLQVLADKLEQLKLIDASKKELRLLELANVESSESNKEENGTNPQEAKSSYDSFEMVSTSEISPILPGRKSIGLAKTMVSEFDKKKSLPTPDESPVTRKRRKLKSKSVEKQSNNLRYELFEKSLQKIIKKNKKVKMEGMSVSSPGKRSKFYRNSMFVSGFTEDPREEDNEEDDDKFIEERKKSLKEKEKRSSRGSGTLMPQEIPEQEESSMSEEETSSDETDKSDSFKEEDLENDLDLNTQTNEKECFSDDESNLRRYAKKQEGFSSLITIDDFEFIKLISKGAYGRVWLVKRKITGDHYAMKIINFADRKNMNQIASLKTEKKVFEKLKGDFVVKAIFTFVHNSYLCIVMEFMIGGDFGHILEKFGALEEDDARFYIAEMVLALDNLHQLDIVHRDLKPDNILLNKNGHIKLTDFGLSEVGVQKHTKIKKAKRNSIFNSLTAAKTSDKRLSLLINPVIPTKPQEKQAPVILKDEFSTIPEVDEEAPEIAPPPQQTEGNRVIGTPDYMAPEVINGTCYDDPCIDWWSVGVLLFEFLVGIPPFNDPDVDVVFENIVKRKIPWDELQIGYDEGCITPEAKDLIDSLLELDRTKRLGAKGIDEIKSHIFFKKINWDEILKSKAPIIPVTENDIDVSNFEKENKKFLQSELENPFHGGNEGTQSVSINKENFELARVDILHEENEKVVSEATNTISQEELEKMRKARLVNRKWSVFD